MPAADTEALLDRLDRVREARGSVELFDALLAEQPEGVAKALALHLRHPLLIEVSAWLSARGIEPPTAPGAQAVADRLGITDLESVLAEEAKTRARLTASADEAWKRARRAESVANAYAAVLVLLVGVAITGWLAALDALPISIRPETVVKQQSDEKVAPATPKR